MAYTIYFNQKPLLLIESKTAKARELLQKPGTVLQEKLSNETVQTMLDNMEQPGTTAGIFFHTSAEEVLTAFKHNMNVIEASGGFVHTSEGTVLLIFRNGKWDLPKGKIDHGETASVAALREVNEETGLNQLQLEAALTSTYHTYRQNEKLILKESHWFLMNSPQQQNMIPQLEEGIEKCEWVKMDALATYLENTHPSIIDVLQLGIEKLNAAKRI